MFHISTSEACKERGLVM